MAPYGNFKSGEFVRWDVRVFGELSPTSEPIPDLDKAARNSRGTVEYATRTTLIMPIEALRGNGALLIDVPNRGRPISLSLFNSPRNMLVPLGSFDQGTGFLQDAGYTVAAISWELGHGVELPSFKGADGTTRYIEGTAFASSATPQIFSVPHLLTQSGLAILWPVLSTAPLRWDTPKLVAFLRVF